jgi:hypothetical protein
MAAHRSNRAAADIDEAFLLHSIREQDGSSGTGKPASFVPSPEEKEHPKTPDAIPVQSHEEKERPAVRRNSRADYSSRYLQKGGFRSRQCVYISQRIHNTILEIVKILSDKEVTVGGYIDTIVSSHLDTHKEEITDLYRSELNRKREKSPLEL